MGQLAVRSAGASQRNHAPLATFRADRAFARTQESAAVRLPGRSARSASRAVVIRIDHTAFSAAVVHARAKPALVSATASGRAAFRARLQPAKERTAHLLAATVRSAFRRIAAAEQPAALVATGALVGPPVTARRRPEGKISRKGTRGTLVRRSK